MKYVIILIFLGFTSLMLSYDNIAHGLWIPQSPQELLENSDVIFVGNITSVKVLKFEKQSSYTIQENGTDKNIVENYTLNLDEYTVNVEEVLKNPQNSSKITVRQPTIGAIGRISGLDGFNVGDRVLFYIEKFDGINMYSPESFKIPKFCEGKDVLTQKRLERGSDFSVIQNGIKVDYGNFTANKPIQFISYKDMNTLSGKSFDVLVGIAKIVGQSTEPVFSQEIHAKSKPCEWIASAEWEFTPKEGNYAMGITTKEDDGNTTGTSYTEFSVKPNALLNPMPPLEQFKSGIAVKDVTCKQSFQLIIRAEDGSPACVRPDTAQILIERGWAKTLP
ncbi:MAG: hypothetical protein HY223_08190 [Thaumarchaeota archaeon]|nr:hypothetical protein [Nitrososphaerota archaeon]